MDITKIQGLDKKWQETILRILCDYNNDQDKLAAIDRINELTGLGVLYSSEVFKKLVIEFELSAGVVKNFAHTLTKDADTEALNKHNVMVSVCPQCDNPYPHITKQGTLSCEECGFRQTAP